MYERQLLMQLLLDHRGCLAFDHVILIDLVVQRDDLDVELEYP